MKTLVAALVTALLVFTLATGWIEVVQPRLDLLASASSSKSDNAGIRSAKKRSSTRRVTKIEEDDDEDDESPNEKMTVKKKSEAKASRNEPDVATKAKARVSEQLAEVKRKESRLLEREETLRMLYEDIRSELAAVEEIRRRSARELALAERKVLEVASSRTTVASLSNEATRSSSANTRSIKGADTSVVNLIHSLTKQGSFDSAAKLLANFKDRELAKVLSELNSRDQRLADQLYEQIRTSKVETPIRR